ncbi:response regulator [Candidatus Parcubacteria bacterium]|nr:response regulator [Candidatus Parcubacteria bacterium]
MTQISADPIKVLCVEDEQFISELYKRALEREGYQTTIISDGIEGLEQAKTNRYDVILLDIMVPGLLGVDVLDKLRKEAPNLKAKIIITTNLEQDDKARQAIESLADAYLIKAEITPRQLVEFLDHLDLK